MKNVTLLPIFAITAAVLLTTMISAKDFPSSGPDTAGLVIYQWRSRDHGISGAATGLVVRDVIEDGRRFQKVQQVRGGMGRISFAGDKLAIDNPGSKDIHIEIDPEAKSTTYAGLTFTAPCVLGIAEDYTLLADVEGLMAKDAAGTEWKSRRVTIDGTEAIRFLSGDLPPVAEEKDVNDVDSGDLKRVLPGNWWEKRGPDDVAWFHAFDKEGRRTQSGKMTTDGDVSKMPEREMDIPRVEEHGDTRLSSPRKGTLVRFYPVRSSILQPETWLILSLSNNRIDFIALPYRTKRTMTRLDGTVPPVRPPVPDANDVALQGRWILVDGEFEGHRLTELVVSALAESLTVSGGRFVKIISEGRSRVKGDSVDEARNEGNLTFNTEGKVNEIDFIFDRGPLAGKYRKGIYRLDGKRLIVCYRTDDGPRPKEFQSLKGDNDLVVSYYQRVGVGESESSKPSELAGKPKGWPPMNGGVAGGMEVRVRNPNEFSVKVGLRSGGKGKDFTVDANGVESVYVANGRYDIYFQYSTDPDGLYQGDSFTLSNNGVEIRIVKVVNGNYGIRKVK